MFRDALQRPPRHRRRVRWLLVAAVVSAPVLGLVELTDISPASACSVAAQGSKPTIHFTGRAIARELTIESVALTYDWTFVVTSWDENSSARRRRPGERITVSVIEERPPSAITVPPSGQIPNSCADIQFGVKTAYVRRGRFEVTAVVARNDPREYAVSNFSGSLRPVLGH
jgi:hypothetical protein